METLQLWPGSAPRERACSPLPALPGQTGGGSHLLRTWTAVRLPASQLILDLNRFCYWDLAVTGHLGFPRMGKVCFLGIEFPVSSQIPLCGGGIGLFTLGYSARATWEHGDAEAATGVEGEKKWESRKETNLSQTNLSPVDPGVMEMCGISEYAVLGEGKHRHEK